MSISAISSNPYGLDPTQTATGGLSGNLQSLADNYNALGTALQTGDLGAAQQAFTSLMQSAPSGGAAASSSATSSGSSQVGADIASLGQALQSGNLQGAQQAFANLQQAVQSAGHAHGGQHAAGGGGGSGAASGDSDAASTVVNEVTTTNADGTLSVTTTYADGTSSTAIEPNPNPTVNTSKLDPSNRDQQRTLLAAQEQSNPH